MAFLELSKLCGVSGAHASPATAPAISTRCDCGSVRDFSVIYKPTRLWLPPHSRGFSSKPFLTGVSFAKNFKPFYRECLIDSIKLFSRKSLRNERLKVASSLISAKRGSRKNVAYREPGYMDVLKSINLAKSKEDVYVILRRAQNDESTKLKDSTLHFILQQQKVWWKSMAVFNWIKMNQTDASIHDCASYAVIFDFLVKANQWEKIDSIWASISSSEFVPDQSVFTSLITSCSAVGRTDLAMHWFSVACNHSIVMSELSTSELAISELALSSLMRCLCRDRNLESALCVMEAAEKFHFRSTEPYNCLMRLYCHYGMVAEVEALLLRMKSLSVACDSYSLSEAISAFGNAGDIVKAQNLFDNMLFDYGVKPCAVTYTSLISMYGRNGNVQSAIDLFQELKNHKVKADVATYNSMITLMGRQSRYDDAESLFVEMQKNGIKPNLRTFNSLIIMYGKASNLKEIVRVLRTMPNFHLDFHEDMMDTIINICSKSNNIDDVNSIFEEIKKLNYEIPPISLKKIYEKIYSRFGDKDSHSRFTLFQTRNSKGERNKKGGENVSRNGKIPGPRSNSAKKNESMVTVGIMGNLKNCEKSQEAIDTLEREIKSKSSKSTLKKRKNEALICSMIEVCGRQNLIPRAESLFNQIFDNGKPPDLLSFNTLMNVYANNGMVDEANKLFDKMNNHNVNPDATTFTILLKAYGNCKSSDKHKPSDCVEVYKRMIDSPLCHLDAVAYNTILNVCSKHLSLLEIQNLFKEMKLKRFKPNVITYNSMIDLYVKANRMLDAEEVFHEMKENDMVDSVSYATMINGYGKRRQLDRMESVMNDAMLHHVALSISSYNAAIDAYGKSGYYQSMEHTLERLLASDLQPDSITYNTIIHAYGDGGKLVEMEECLEAMKDANVKPDLWTYNILIGAYGNLNMPYASVKVLRNMQSEGIMPDAITYNNLIAAFEKSGDYLEAARWSLWRKQAGFSP